ncbi:hypothetical protein Lbir_1950 [Legionella birminghamensis]|uniref:Uncharacterized protein n=1 Tax=Legionella birminghamensis TaxID=28083 RepID=A0A378JUB5_9GAMM|nr:hypothetical protein [Legionella birminghamensis]KTC69810.1 hypothetical protein Lbir_1950 [Legionella birminghamensis]STX60918.1 Uncharacterised protein [Legionella birminghamensis]
MRRNVYKNSMLFIGAIVLSGAVYSASVEKEELAIDCKYLGSNLSQLAATNTKEYCSVDVNHAGAVMKLSGEYIERNRTHSATETLKLAHKTLEHVKSETWSCVYFSSLVVPYIEEVKHIIDQLEVIHGKLSK